ncbi:OmpA family protein [Colwellia sp. TT2012]|uniref:OmpA family protein n=1 Tax=Colwellia sp. TT2012 TaxID=1720342 RepID=UPI00070D2863|nr:OmpA family protein [Colwellia sp. TT2012]
MRPFKLSKLCQFIALSVFSFSLAATEQATAESLVGHAYLGGHAMYLKTDEDRLYNSHANSSIDHASGLGVEAGYRLSEFFETRLSYTHFNPVAKHHNYDLSSGKSIALDLLYFPFKESFYLVGGADFLTVEKSNLSAALGAGYRHYLSKDMAVYFEGKGHYQFDEHFTDFSSKIGFIYYFGRESQKIKRTVPTKVMTIKPAAPAITAGTIKDSDNDGIVDNQDNCANTPIIDKVNAKGCTIFTAQQKSMRLLVNFENDKSEVRPEYKSEVAKAAEFMNTYPYVNLTIEGHTSALGSEIYNQVLSEKRAQAIVAVLINDFDIDMSRLNSIGYGETKLMNPADTAVAHNDNRRIEASISISKQVAEKR